MYGNELHHTRHTQDMIFTYDFCVEKIFFYIECSSKITVIGCQFSDSHSFYMQLQRNVKLTIYLFTHEVYDRASAVVA